MLCYSPDRLTRKFAYQALLIEEFARVGTRVEFVKGRAASRPKISCWCSFRACSPSTRRPRSRSVTGAGKAHRAKTGSINVLSGAPFGYRYVRKSEHAGAAYEIVEHEAALVAELFRRYADDGASIAELTRWLTGAGRAHPHR